MKRNIQLLMALSLCLSGCSLFEKKGQEFLATHAELEGNENNCTVIHYWNKEERKEEDLQSAGPFSKDTAFLIRVDSNKISVIYVLERKKHEVQYKVNYQDQTVINGIIRGQDLSVIQLDTEHRKALLIHTEPKTGRLLIRSLDMTDVSNRR